MAARNRCKHLMRHEDTQLCFEYPRRDAFPGILKESVGQQREPGIAAFIVPTIVIRKASNQPLVGAR